MKPQAYYPLDSVAYFSPGEQVAIVFQRGEKPRLEIITSVEEGKAVTNMGTILSDEGGDFHTAFLTGEYFPEYGGSATIN